MISSLDALVRNLSGDGFKYQSQEFSEKLIELINKKVCIHMKHGWVYQVSWK